MAAKWRTVTDSGTIEVAEEPGQWRTVVPDEPRRRDSPRPSSTRRKQLEKQFAAGGDAAVGRCNTSSPAGSAPPEPSHVLRRGDPHASRGKRPAPAASTCSAATSCRRMPRRPSAALALAKWLGSEQHPLTARVLVNRVWRHHFGAGLVDTPSDFGTQGERPTHPELLDWLASEFMARGWRLKDLHRLICTSAAYRQSSRAGRRPPRRSTPTRGCCGAFRPGGWRRRPSATACCSPAARSTSTMGGPGVNIYQPRTKPDSANGCRGRDPGPETWRRTIYLLRVRGADDGVFKPFDVPDCGQVRAKRSASTTPLQALNLFNSPFIDRAGAAAGGRARARSGRRSRPRRSSVSSP